MTFLEYVLEEDIGLNQARSEIQDWVKEWHEVKVAHEETTLPQFLGLTEKEYCDWVSDDNNLDDIIQTHRDNKLVDGMLKKARTKKFSVINPPPTKTYEQGYLKGQQNMWKDVKNFVALASMGGKPSDQTMQEADEILNKYFKRLVK